MELEWREKWDRRFLKLAEHIASWSKDPSTQVGAVIVDKNNIVQGMGYNGFPRGVADTDERYGDRAIKYPLVVHAELNAILNAGHRAKGSKIYVVPTLMEPCACPECAKAIVQAGIVENVYWAKDAKDNVKGRNYEFWEKQGEFTRILFQEGGVRFRGVKSS